MNQADEAWVQELYRYNAPKLYKVVLRRLEDAEAAQDIAVSYTHLTLPTTERV